MAFSCNTRNILLILPLIVITLSTIAPLSSSFSPTDKVTKPLVSQLCSQPTIYEHFCNGWLNSDPKTFTLDLHGLLVMLIQKTEAFSYSNLEMMKGLARNRSTDPNLKIPYGSCVTDYELSITAMKGAEGFASSESYMLASRAAYKAKDIVAGCATPLKGLTTAYIATRNEMSERMCNTCRVICDILTSPL